MKHMKWWGWGEPGIMYRHDNKPDFAPFVKEKIDVDVAKSPAVSLRFDDVFGDSPDKTPIPAPNIDSALREHLEKAIGEKWVIEDGETRVIHTFGKSLRDLVRLRKGDFGRLPDLVLYPGNEAEVEEIMNAALSYDAVLIPFGGGTNITGSLEVARTEKRTVLSVDLQRMGKVIAIDTTSQQARIEAGALGPDLEEQLNVQGWSLGHFPDSFTHSALGGWIATRSSGMQSDKYGDISQITKAVRVVTPQGMLATRAVPSTAAGPSIREMILGSEGRLGIITEATVQVHRLPEKRTILGYIFPTWKAGLECLREVAASDAQIFVARLSDANETAFSFATQKKKGFKGWVQATGLARLLKIKSIDSSTMCLSFIGFEGSRAHVALQRQLVGRIVKQHGGLCVGAKPGELYDQKKFDTPYIRDFLLDIGILADVSETAAPWSELHRVHQGVHERVKTTFDELGIKGYVMCHLSHTEHTGACLYFTFALAARADRPEIEQYDAVKHAAQQAFIDLGATLSHHHAVGREHAEWLEPDISAPGVNMLRSLVVGVDPGNNLNPGAIVKTD